jgi:predicted nucleotide-binding protein (sugar kinase/HSP70/actin superfamily)
MLAIYHVIKQIRNKLTQNNLMVVKADTGRAIIITNNELQKQKSRNFINRNQFQTLEKDPTENYHKQTQHTLHKT